MSEFRFPPLKLATESKSTRQAEGESSLEVRLSDNLLVPSIKVRTAEEGADERYYRSQSISNEVEFRHGVSSISPETAAPCHTVIVKTHRPSVPRTPDRPCQPRLKKEPPDPPGPSGDPEPPDPLPHSPWPDKVTRVFNHDLFFGRLTLRLLPRNPAGLSMAVQHGGKIYTKALGNARRFPDTNPEIMNPNMILAIGSANKTLTAILVARMLSEKGISPDSTIGEYLPKDSRPATAVERSLNPGKGVASLTWRELLTMRSGLVAAPNKIGYGVLQTDVSNFDPDSDWDYSNEDYHAVRYPLYHLAGNSKPTGPLLLTPALWSSFLNNYHRLVGEFTAAMTEQYIFSPLGIQPWEFDWGYSKYGNPPQIPTFLPLYYTGTSGSGNNPWVKDNRSNAGIGSLIISARNLCRVMSEMRIGGLLTPQWMTVLTTINDYSGATNGDRSYCGGMWVSLDSAAGRYYHHRGIVGRARAQWMRFPYANIQAVLITNSTAQPNWLDFMHAYKHAWSPKIPDWILDPKIID